MSGQTAELLRKISETEQLELAFEIWEKYAGQRISVKLTQNQKAELERRLQVHRENPMAGRSWDDLKSDLGR